MDTLTIREILDQVLRGQIRIPAFQRGFVWEPDRVAYLMDSIYKRYPFGSLLFWRTKEQLRVERDLGPFTLPDPKADYPVDYVLDGQQRITSIFGVFQNELKMEHNVNWNDVYFDMEADENAQETQFAALQDKEAEPARYFPLKALFDTVSYRAATKGLDDEVAQRIDHMQEVFKETRIPIQMSTTEDKATVAIIFERVNRQGVELDTLQLLSAWSWSEDFDLQEQFGELAEQLAPFGFAEVGEDTNLLLRCCSAVLSNDASPRALMELNGEEVRENFDSVMNGVKGAIDYLRANFQAQQLANLPFSTLLVPLSVFFATKGTKEAAYNNNQRSQINRWFWRSAFSRRYSSGVIRNLNTDILEILKLKNKNESALGNFQIAVSPDFFLENAFGMGNVNTKTFILMLAQNSPLSFISGARVDLAKTLKAANRAEFHHLMPRAFLRETDQQEIFDSVLANFCFLSRSDNRALGGEAPSGYKSKMAENVDEIISSAICPKSVFSDDFESFVRERADMLAVCAQGLCESD